MKKILIGLVCVIVAFVFVACGKQNVENNFALTISVEKTTLQQGESVSTTVQLKNQSGKDCEISFYITPFFPHIPCWEYPVAMFEVPEFPEVYIIKSNDSFLDSWTFGDDLKKGMHELKFKASFFFDNQKVIIWSNTVVLTVQ